MNWTNEKPIEPGWYWYKPSDDEKQRNPDWRIHPFINCGDFYKIGRLLFDWRINGFSRDPLNWSPEGQFAGPIPGPTIHPVDTLKDFMAANGTPMDSESEKQARAICDEEITPLQAKDEEARGKAAHEDSWYWDGYIDGLNRRDVF